MEALLRAKSLWKCTKSGARLSEPSNAASTQTSRRVIPRREPLKPQLEGHESFTKIYLLYTARLEEGSLEIEDYVRSMEGIPRRLIVLMTLMRFSSALDTQQWIWESSKQELAMDLVMTALC
jgi:hypothetical protein